MERVLRDNLALRTIRRGVLLLEVLVALALLVGAGLAVLTVLQQSTGAMGRMRDQRTACDLACSAMARIEAGIDTPETLDGPVPAWEEGQDGGTIQAGGGGAWELDVRTDLSQFAGLTRVTVEAIRHPAPGDDRIVASYTLTQMVRMKGGLGAPEATGSGDAIGDAQRKALKKGGGA